MSNDIFLGIMIGMIISFVTAWLSIKYHKMKKIRLKRLQTAITLDEAGLWLKEKVR
jgi:hypothetical protein